MLSTVVLRCLDVLKFKAITIGCQHHFVNLMTLSQSTRNKPVAIMIDSPSKIVNHNRHQTPNLQIACLLAKDTVTHTHAILYFKVWLIGGSVHKHMK